MDFPLICKYLNDKNKVKIISMGHHYWDLRHEIDFFAIKLKARDGIDYLERFQHFLAASSSILSKNKDYCNNVTILSLVKLEKNDLSYCPNLKYLRVNVLSYFPSDEETPASLQKTYVDKMEIKSLVVSNRFTKSIVKIKTVIVSSDDKIDDDAFDNLRVDDLTIHAFKKNISALARGTKKIDVHLTCDIDLDVFIGVEDLKIDYSFNDPVARKISLTNELKSLKSLRVNGTEMDLNSIGVGLFPSLKNVTIQSPKKIVYNPRSFDGVDFFDIFSESISALPVSKNLSVRVTDIIRGDQICEGVEDLEINGQLVLRSLPETLKSLGISNNPRHHHIDKNVTKNLTTLRFETCDYSYVSDLVLRRDCKLFLSLHCLKFCDIVLPNIETIFLRFSHNKKFYCQPGLKKIYIKTFFDNTCEYVFNDDIEVVIWNNSVFDDDKKKSILNFLPDTIKELYVHRASVTDKNLKRFTHLESFGCYGVKKFKKTLNVKNYYDIPYDLFDKLTDFKIPETFKVS